MSLRAMPLRKSVRAGFSMVELMVTLAVMAILLSVGVPSFSELLKNLRMTATANSFFASMNLARSEAIKRGMPVYLSTVDGGSDWSKGWVVFVDKNDTSAPDAGDELVFSHGPVPAGIAVEPKFTSRTVQYLVYNGAGRTQINGNSSAPQAGSFLFTADNRIKRKIVVNFLGRARVCNPVTESASC